MSDERWATVEAPWRAAFELAWEAHLAGSPAVGAVIVDERGAVVAHGRSRRSEAQQVPNQLSGSRMAHAEVNALAGLAVDQHTGLTLYVTLQPCLLCAAAIAISHVPHVLFAGEDPVWRYLNGLPRWDERLSARWPTMVGPLDGKLAAWAALVPLVERLERDPTGARIDEYERALPLVTALARQVVADGTARFLRHFKLDDAMDRIWDRLPPAT